MGWTESWEYFLGRGRLGAEVGRLESIGVGYEGVLWEDFLRGVFGVSL